jgi:hypothetical protein
VNSNRRCRGRQRKRVALAASTCPGEAPEVLLDGGEAAQIEAWQRLGFHGGAARVLKQARDLRVGFRGGGDALNRGWGDALTCGSRLGRRARGGLRAAHESGSETERGRG